MQYKFETRYRVKYFTFDLLMESKLVLHWFSTRIGGVSLPPYDSMNLGISTGDRKENVLKNRDIFKNALGYYPEESIMLDHDNNIYILKDAGKKGKPRADAVITRLRHIPLTIFFADCVPIFIVDSGTPSIALVHAGWRGTAKDVAGNTIRTMKKEFGSDPAKYLVGIGPSIGPCCFLVDEDVAPIFLDTFGEWKDLMKKTSNNKWSIDLWRLNQRLLISAGVPERNITLCYLCTACQKELFYSYRRDKEYSGRMAAIIALK